jgi:hypothetical protein
MNLQIAPLVKIKYQYDTNIKEGHPIDGRQLNLYLEIIGLNKVINYNCLK